MSNKETQSAATSSLTGCAGHAESSDVAVLGSVQPPSKCTGLALHSCKSLLAGWKLGC